MIKIINNIIMYNLKHYYAIWSILTGKVMVIDLVVVLTTLNVVVPNRDAIKLYTTYELSNCKTYILLYNYFC